MSRRRATVAVAVVGWIVAVAVVGWLSWTAIASAGREVVAPVVPSTRAGATPTPPPSVAGPTSSTGSSTTTDTAPTTTSPSTAPSTRAGPQSQTFSTSGGAVAVTCSGAALTVTYATPANGWRVESESEGSSSAKVEFRRDGDRVRLELTCEGGRPAAVVEEDGDSSGPGG